MVDGSALGVNSSDSGASRDIFLHAGPDPCLHLTAGHRVFGADCGFRVVEFNINGHLSKPMGPFSPSDRHDLPRFIDESVPGIGTYAGDFVF